MITSILTFFGSSACGTILGSFFAWLNKRNEIEELKLKQSHEQEMKKIDNAQALALADKAREQVREAGEQAVADEEAKAFTASQVAANQKPQGKAAEIIWSAIRPLLTVWLLVMVSIITSHLGKLVGGLSSLPTDTLLPLYTDVIYQVIALASFAISWWFGARGTSRRDSMKTKKGE